VKGKICKNGWLSIEGRGCTAMFCPLSVSECRCGDWCPLFGEPKTSHVSKFTSLIICQNRTLTFTEFVDEREAECTP